MRRTESSLIYRRTRSLRAVQMLLAHASMERTIPYLRIAVHDALELAEQTDARGAGGFRTRCPERKFCWLSDEVGLGVGPIYPQNIRLTC